MKIAVVIPAYNEQESIARVIQALPEGLHRIVVVDNASTDETAMRAREAGAHVVSEPRRGYGSACLRGIAEVQDANIVVFLDGDFSDDPAGLPALVRPIEEDLADLVIGSRLLGTREKGALPPHALFGNRLACFLIHRLFGCVFTDLGPFRAIRRTALNRLGMTDTTYGWTVEMQARAALLGVRSLEVPVPYRKRIGKSKISGTVQGSLKAGSKILWTIFDLWRRQKAIRRESSSTQNG